MIYFERVIKGLSIALDAVGGEHTAVAKDLREPIKDLLHFVRLHQLDHEWREKYRAELTEVQQAGAEVDFDFDDVDDIPQVRGISIETFVGGHIVTRKYPIRQKNLPMIIKEWKREFGYKNKEANQV